MKHNKPKEMIKNAVKAAVWDGYSNDYIKEIVENALKGIEKENISKEKS